jgi:addiction module HigA family antidote
MLTWWITSRKGGDVMSMLNPPHPGRIVRQECLEALGLSVTEAAKVLDVTRQTLNNLVNEKAAISPEMAIRLEKAFGSTADTWLRMQAAYDLAQARKNADQINVQRVAAA